MHNYQITHYFLCLKTLFGFFYHGLHPFDFLSMNQRQKLFHFAATNSHESIMLFHIYLTYVLACQSTFLI